MRELLIVGSGSFIGGISRYMVSSLVLHSLPQARFPFATLLVNFVGCFLIGVIAGIILDSNPYAYQLRLFLITGILGGFTTFSAFGLETILLFKGGNFELAAIYVLSSVIVCLAAVGMGMKVVSGQ